jgi:hypothetical protein
MNVDEFENLDADSLAPQVYKFTHKGERYIAREATAGAALQYRSASLSGTEMTFNGEDDARTIKNMAGMASVENLLISLCTVRVGKRDGADVEVPLSKQDVDRWQLRVQRKVYDWIKDTSGLDEKDDVEALQKQIDKLQKKLVKAQAKEAKQDKETPGGNS